MSIKADRVLLAKPHVLDAAGTRAEAVAIAGRRILLAGSGADVMELRGPPHRG